MAISINGSTNVISGVAVGGLPDGIVDTDMLAADAVTDAKINLTGEIKAWVNWNGIGTVAIRGSGNVSSITDHGTGNYSVNMTTALSDTNYCISGTTAYATGVTESTFATVNGDSLLTTSSFNIKARDDAGTLRDVSHFFVAVIR